MNFENSDMVEFELTVLYSKAMGQTNVLSLFVLLIPARNDF